MRPQTYKIICLHCKAQRIIAIIQAVSGELIDWVDHNPDALTAKIISGRKRLDGNFGWQCICGNNDILTDQEIMFIEDKQDPNPDDISKVIKNLVVQEPRFAMEKV